MNIDIFDTVPDYLLERFVLFDKGLNNASWGDLYEAIVLLKTTHSECVFNEAPMIYMNLEKKSSGFLFIERNSDKLYYVY